jgi:hypothetical protein
MAVEALKLADNHQQKMELKTNFYNERLHAKKSMQRCTRVTR